MPLYSQKGVQVLYCGEILERMVESVTYIPLWDLWMV